MNRNPATLRTPLAAERPPELRSKPNRDKRQERAIKDKIKALLKELPADECWFNMPVPFGYGTSTVDFIVCFRGWFLAIEAKRPRGGHTQGKQVQTMLAIDRANGVVVFVKDEEDLMALRRILFQLPVLARPMPSAIIFRQLIQNVETV